LAADSTATLGQPIGAATRTPGDGGAPRTRGWLIRRALVTADGIALTAAFTATSLFFGSGGAGGTAIATQYLVFVLTLPAWVFAAKLHELYDRDEERTEHTTFDDFVGVLQLVTLGVWLLYLGAHATDLAQPSLGKVATFWAASIVAVTGARALARAYCRRHPDYVQNTLIVGAGDIGQLVARKFAQHPEYGIRVVGFADADPRPLRADLSGQRVLGSSANVEELVRAHAVERVVVAFSTESASDSIALVRRLKRLDVQIDIVPRLFDTIGPNVVVHAVEGLPLLGLPASKLLPFSRTIKRTVDLVGASALLLATAPLFAFIAWRIRRDSDGPVFFRQARLGEGMREFTALKFRTMAVDTDDSAHRDYIKQTMSADAAPAETGFYKLDRGASVTRSGRWLRKTSLDELPQLLNVVRGEMSLVGPRPCIPYETENFLPHHFERFLVPAGITGLWQVTARAHSTFGEALELDVAYARNWSLGLDLMLLLRTPFQLIRQRKGTA
jgi:exopolysaccharide biosynthesis polyprenyl glycosylphosphotransferase